MSERCIDGRLMRHKPFQDDPNFEHDVGECPECDGKGCHVDLPSEAEMDSIVKQMSDCAESLLVSGGWKNTARYFQQGICLIAKLRRHASLTPTAKGFSAS